MKLEADMEYEPKRVLSIKQYIKEYNMYNKIKLESAIYKHWDKPGRKKLAPDVNFQFKLCADFEGYLKELGYYE